MKKAFTIIAWVAAWLFIAALMANESGALGLIGWMFVSLFFGYGILGNEDDPQLRQSRGEAADREWRREKRIYAAKRQVEDEEKVKVQADTLSKFNADEEAFAKLRIDKFKKEAESAVRIKAEAVTERKPKARKILVHMQTDDGPRWIYDDDD